MNFVGDSYLWRHKMFASIWHKSNIYFWPRKLPIYAKCCQLLFIWDLPWKPNCCIGRQITTQLAYKTYSHQNKTLLFRKSLLHYLHKSLSISARLVNNSNCKECNTTCNRSVHYRIRNGVTFCYWGCLHWWNQPSIHQRGSSHYNVLHVQLRYTRFLYRRLVLQLWSHQLLELNYSCYIYTTGDVP